MKTTSEVLSEKFAGIHTFKAGQIVNAVFDRGVVRKIDPCIHTEMKCSMCHGETGVPVRDNGSVWWSCANPECIQINAKKGVPPKPEELPLSVLLERSGVPRLLHHAKFSDWNHGPVMKKDIASWLMKPTGFCILSGDRGRGKTYIASCIIGYMTRSMGATACFMDVIETKYRWLEEMRSDGLKTLSTKMTQCDLLVIDDIDKIKQSDSFHEFMYLVVNSRYASMKPTVITTNASLGKLEEIMGAALSSRLFAKESLLIEVQGEDLRQ